MKKLLMTMVLVGCVVAVSAQGLPRRTLGTRFPGQSAAVTPKQKHNVVTTNGVEWTCRVVDDAVILEGIVSERREKIRGKGLAVVRSIGASIPKKTSGDLTIPDTIAGKSVRCIGCNAFYYCDKLTSVAIPSSVTNIGDNAFVGCRGLTSITIQPGVTSIGVRAFSGCCGLATIMIPPGVTSIGEDAFYGCSGLTSVTIQPSVTSIGDRAFSGCSELTAIVIPPGVKSIGRAAFSCCNNLTSVTIPSSMTNIGVCAFYECNGLTSVTIPPGVTSIGTGAFSGCGGLADVNGFVIVNGVLYDYLGDASSVVIPSSVTRIGEYAFSNEMIAKIGAVAQRRPSQSARGADRSGQGFTMSNNCSNLTSVTIPSSVTNIGSGAFRNCHGLKRVDITDLAKWCEIFICDSGSNPLGNALNGEEVKDLIIPEGVTNIGDFAFSNCKGLTSVTIPSSVASIGSEAFYGCSGLMSITIPLGVTSIGEKTFCECRGLMSVSIPSSVTKIGRGAFGNCLGLKRVDITDLAKWCEISFGDGIFAVGNNPLEYARHLYLNGEEVKDLIIPDGVTNIKRTFSGCSGLTSVTIPSSVTSIGYLAFSGCSGLMSVAIPSTVKNIGNGAFWSCSGLTSVTIPPSVTNIDALAFSGCNRLRSVKMLGERPNSPRNDIIFKGGMRPCKNLKFIHVPANAKNWAGMKEWQGIPLVFDGAKADEKIEGDKSTHGNGIVAEKLQGCDFLLNKDFKKNAKFYLCLFSASWCGPCRAEMPRIAKTYAETLKDDPDIELIYFSCDRDDSKAMSWAKGHDVKFPVVKPKGGNPLDLHTRGIPHLFIVKADGTLLEEGHPMRLFNEAKFRELKQ